MFDIFCEMNIKKVIYWGRGGAWGNGENILISSWKCNFSIYLDIQVYYLDIQAITTLLCLLLVLYVLVSSIHSFFYLTTALKGCERDVVYIMNDGFRAWGALKSLPSNRGLRIKAKKCLYKGVIVPMALYRAEAWGMRSAERRKSECS